MEAIALIFTKFSEELIAAQLAVLCFTAALATYWLLIRKKKKESAEWVPAALVRAYLDRVRADERETRIKLFGEDSVPAAVGGVSLSASLGSASPDPSLLREIDTLRSQLSASDQRVMEFDRMMNALRSEKAALEQKLRDMPAAAPGAVSAADPALKKELDDLRARLQEYEVIEDDLANLKKFQKENEVLRQKLESIEKAPPALNLVQGGPPPEPEQPVVIAASAPVAAPVTVISGGAGEGVEAPAAPVAEAAPAEPAPAPVAEMNTNVLQAVQPTVEGDAAAPAAAAPVEKTAKQKEEELLSEFEKMLAS